jgi:hypothetical protein
MTRLAVVGVAVAVLLLGCASAGEVDGSVAPATSPPVVATTVVSTSTTASSTTSSPPPTVPGVVLQEGNGVPVTRLGTLPSSELADSGIGVFINAEHAGEWVWETGLAWIRVFMDPCGRWQSVDWESEDYTVDPREDRLVDGLVANNVRVMVVLDVADPECKTVFHKSEEDVGQYLGWVEYMVGHFRGRVDWYEILNEPDLDFAKPAGMPVDAYLRLVEQTVPVIRAGDPDAAIVVGAVVDTRFDDAREWMWGVLASEVMATVDGFSWHPMYGAAPTDDPRGIRQPEIPQMARYWESYPALVDDIKAAAEASGFTGEYLADEMGWRTTYQLDDTQEPYGFSPLVAAKYFARAIVIHLGMDVRAAAGFDLEADGGRAHPVIRALCTAMAGNRPDELAHTVDTDAANLRTVSFTLADGARLLAVWTDGPAVDDDLGVPGTVTLHGIQATTITGIDVLHSAEQPLDFRIEGADTVVDGLLVKDYPILVRIVES